MEQLTALPQRLLDGAAALLAGVCAELFLSPVLLRLMLERILG